MAFSFTVRHLLFLAPLSILASFFLFGSNLSPEENFKRWATSNGIEFYGISLKKSPLGGTGVFADKDIRAGETVMCVPSGLILNEGFIARTALAPVLRELPNKHDVVRVLFVARMLFDRENEPFGAKKFGPWYDLWPDTESLPITWSAEEWEAVGINISIEDDIKEVIDVTRKFPSIFRNKQAYTRENIIKAIGLINSRVYGPVGNSGGFSKKNLIPGLDCFNHDPVPNRPKRILTFDEREVCIAPGTDVKAGEEVYTHYGYDGVNFWAWYGFLPADGDEKVKDSSYPFQFKLRYDAVGTFASLAFPEDPKLMIIRATEAKLVDTLTPWVRLTRGLTEVDPDLAKDPTLWDNLACLSPARTGCTVNRERDRVWLKEFLNITLNLGGVNGSRAESHLIDQLKANPRPTKADTKKIQAALYRRSLKQMIERVIAREAL